jgi:hypothetical protein
MHAVGSTAHSLFGSCAVEFGSMRSRSAAAGGALGPARWQRSLHPSRHGRLPLRSRRPARAAQPTARDGSATSGGASDPHLMQHHIVRMRDFVSPRPPLTRPVIV